MLDDRLQQWSEYESTFDRLLTWLCETETSLKDYVPRSSLEQKEEQMEKYQVTASINFFSNCCQTVSPRPKSKKTHLIGYQFYFFYQDSSFQLNLILFYGSSIATFGQMFNFTQFWVKFQ